MQNPIMMIQRFNQFKNEFKGDPKQTVEQLLKDGKMTQEQFNSLQQQATQFQQLISNFRM